MDYIYSIIIVLFTAYVLRCNISASRGAPVPRPQDGLDDHERDGVLRGPGHALEGKSHVGLLQQHANMYAYYYINLRYNGN